MAGIINKIGLGNVPPIQAGVIAGISSLVLLGTLTPIITAVPILGAFAVASSIAVATGVGTTVFSLGKKYV